MRQRGVDDGERGRTRTFNLGIKSPLLCQLSYAPTVRSTVRTPHPDRNPDLDVTDEIREQRIVSRNVGTRSLGPGQWRDRTQQHGLSGRNPDLDETV